MTTQPGIERFGSMTDVNDLLRRTLAEGEAWKQAAKDRSESYIEDNDTAFKEAHEYLDGPEQRKESLKNANSLREAMGDEAYDQAMNAALFDIRLTRLEEVVRKLILGGVHFHEEGQKLYDFTDTLLRTLKEAE